MDIMELLVMDFEIIVIKIFNEFFKKLLMLEDK